jgi:hypothetical protein
MVILMMVSFRSGTLLTLVSVSVLSLYGDFNMIFTVVSCCGSGFRHSRLVLVSLFVCSCALRSSLVAPIAPSECVERSYLQRRKNHGQ